MGERQPPRVAAKGLDHAHAAFPICSEQPSGILRTRHDIQAFPGRDVLAIILFSYHTECTLRENGEPFGISGMETQIAVKEDEGWRLLHVHYSIAN